MNVSYWLKKTPRPAFVLADDKKIEVPRNARAIRDLCETIKALDPDKLTCLNEKGDVIRSVDLSDDAPEVSATPLTAEQSDLQLFARLLAEGYEHGRKANQPIIDSAMTFVTNISARLAQAEREIDRLRNVNHKQALQIADLTNLPVATDTGDGGIMGALMQGVLQSGALTRTPPAEVTPLKGKTK